MRLSALAACATLLVFSSWARAAERPIVVLMQAEGNGQDAIARPGLESALRIQLRADAELRTAGVGAAATVAERMSMAQGLIQDAGADWVVWADVAETPESEPLALLYVVGRRQGRALVEVVRVPGGKGPDVDRSLALKVTELMSGAQDSGSAAVALGQPAPATADQAPAGTAASALLELGGEVAATDGARGAVFVAVGPRLRLASLHLDVPVELAFVPEREKSTRDGEVRWSELSPALWVRVRASAGPVFVGVGAALQLTIASAEGRAPSGASGSATELLPAWLLALDTEVPLCARASAREGTCAFGARFALGLQQRMRRQRFAIEDRDVADLGRSAPFVRASLVFVP